MTFPYSFSLVAWQRSPAYCREEKVGNYVLSSAACSLIIIMLYLIIILNIIGMPILHH